MLFEATTLTTAARVIAETLEKNYATDPGPIFAASGLDTSQLGVAGARYPWQQMQSLWRLAVETTGDPSFGLHAGRNIRPTTFHALGYAWLASETLLDSLQRLCRYFRVVSTAPIALELSASGNTCVLTQAVTDPSHVPTDTAIDAFVVAVVQLCRTATNARFAPLSVAFERASHGGADGYAEVLGCPVTFGAPATRIVFDRETLEAQLPGENADVARANDKVAESYLQTLEPHKIASEVRELLVDLLPSGKSTQATIARRMNRSLSTLQRQLQNEGTSYQEIREETRSALAREYVRDEDLSLSQVAYMLGFSDQSNFSRAFKRWTGQSPREFRGGTEQR
jgi:AraC-like DNA-binding protein